jgi:hypothetical protein
MRVLRRDFTTSRALLACRTATRRELRFRLALKLVLRKQKQCICDGIPAHQQPPPLRFATSLFWSHRGSRTRSRSSHIRLSAGEVLEECIPELGCGSISSCSTGIALKAICTPSVRVTEAAGNVGHVYFPVRERRALALGPHSTPSTRSKSGTLRLALLHAAGIPRRRCVVLASYRRLPNLPRVS